MEKRFRAAAVVTAGFSPREDDPLAAYTRGRSKALIPIAGKPMVVHVVEALAASRYVDDVIVIVSLDPADGVSFPVPVEYVPDAGSLVGNIEAGLFHVLEHHPELDGALLSSSDVPTVTPAIVDAFVDECLRSDHDAYYSIVERSVMETRFPGASRSYVHLSDGDFAGGDMLLFRSTASLGNRELWERLSGSRKNALRQAAMFGLWPLVKLIFRRLSLAEAERRVCKMLGLDGKAIPFPHAEIGMDVDKPRQLEIVRAEMESHDPDAV